MQNPPTGRAAGSVYTRAPQTPDPVEGACSGLACATVDLVSAALLVAWAFAFVFVVAATVVQLRRAREECDHERDRLLTERRAFEQFASRVASLDPVEPSGAVTDGGTAALGRSSGGDGLAAVETAYRETVMSVDHYDTDYGESLRENMATELGADVATAVLDGGTLHPQLKAAIVRKCGEAHDHRTAVLRDVDDEAASLESAREELGRVEGTVDDLDATPLLEKSFDDLRREYGALGELAGDCEALLDSRQATVADREPGADPDDAHEFYAYLYDPLDVSYPVLSSALSTLSTVRTARRRVLDSLTRRV
jgi:hypothetical protein